MCICVLRLCHFCLGTDTPNRCTCTGFLVSRSCLFNLYSQIHFIWKQGGERCVCFINRIIYVLHTPYVDALGPSSVHTTTVCMVHINAHVLYTIHIYFRKLLSNSRQVQYKCVCAASMTTKKKLQFHRFSRQKPCHIL